MINYIIGKVTEKEENMIVVESNGIGYEIQVSSHTANSIEFDNEYAKILTYMQVKEDGICLYGFISKEEKNIFLKLISVSGIGPKMAIGILSGVTIPELINAIFSKPRLLFKCVTTGVTILVTIITFQIIALSYKVKTWRK